MKHVLLFFALLAGTSSFVSAQEKKAPQSPRVTAEGKNVTVAYGQPAKKGRVIFGELVPYGKVWRLGANEATEITFAKDGSFGGKPVKAGTYTLFTIPEANEWTFILNSELKQWGAYKYEEIKGKNVLEVKAKATKTKAPVEKLTLTVPANKLVVEWDETHVEVPVK
ncbi:DUF2911 domain-containing protein [Chitinophaga pinensis]|uniref:DUF2911 domain-containing protein n=1 Tax=Chitinophaga pinensis (strain ATCC 43595 / DSM 2588 / LMG 13176 / NBRC 15968 / NCIMB 11800 / UQM 2034) TaxID=485918 RepID=A0A979G9R4_CHIPD|nr:DUF2911 domain-containing protein [Chitinophaga pinensis]ACU63257.1 conserved hypothetical protein [Chitinophaga pinensis DSM 2588]